MPKDAHRGSRVTGGNRPPSWLALSLIVAIMLAVRWYNNQSTAISTSAPDSSQNTESIPRWEDRQERDHSAGSKNSRPSSSLPDETEPQLPEIAPDSPSNSRPVDSEVSRSHAPPERFRKKVDGSGRGASSNEAPLPGGDASDATTETKTSQSQGSIYRIEDQTIRGLDGKILFKGTIDLKPTLDRIERGGSNRHRNDGTTFQNREGRLPRKSSGYYKEYVHPTPHEHGPGPQRVIVGRDGDIWYTPDHYKTFKRLKIDK